MEVSIREREDTPAEDTFFESSWHTLTHRHSLALFVLPDRQFEANDKMIQRNIDCFEAANCLSR